jgi:hypothetical protein
MSTPMTKLEQTLIAQARQAHEQAAEYYGKRSSGTPKPRRKRGAKDVGAGAFVSAKLP